MAFDHPCETFDRWNSLCKSAYDVLERIGAETCMKRREFITLIGGAAAVWPLVARAQLPAKTYRIFWISTEPQPDPFLNGFREGLRERGYVEGKNIVLELRYAPGNSDALHTVLSELKGGNVDLAVSSGPAIRAMRAATGVPALFAISGDPVELGLVKSLARPDGNFTGSSFLSLDLAAKRVDLLKEFFFHRCVHSRCCRIRITRENARNGALLSRPLRCWASIRFMFPLSELVNWTMLLSWRATRAQMRCSSSRKV